MPNVLEAVEDGWIPSYWDGDVEVCEPVCPHCVYWYLRFNEDSGYYEPRPLPAVAPNDYGTERGQS